MKDNTLATINTPTTSKEQFLTAFDEYTTVMNTYNAINSGLMFIAQLINAHNENKITLTEEEHKTLMSSYDYLVELIDAYDD